MNANKVIGFLTGILVTFLAGAAFVLSFDNLRTLALSNGITPGLVALWPLGLDAMVVVSCLTVLRGSLSNERTLFAWALVFAFTAASIVFNVLTSETWLSRSIHALPAIVVFLSLELLTGQLKSTIRRTLAVRSFEEIKRATERQRAELQELERRGDEIESLKAELDATKAKLERIDAVRKAIGVRRKEAWERDGCACVDCKVALPEHGNFHCHHIVPRVKGGTTDLSNLVTLCTECHRKRHAKIGRSTVHHNESAERSALLDKVLVYLAQNPNASFAQVGETFGKSKSTVKAYTDELTNAGRLRRNGDGWTVAAN